MRQGTYTILENRPAARGITRMCLAGDTRALERPGQFVNVRVEGFFLRRPFSVCDRTEDGLTLLYKTVGAGTEALAALPAGVKLDVLTGLGNGFHTERAGQRPLLVGGGIGAAPLLWLAKQLVRECKEPTAALGFATAEEAVLVKELEEVGCPVRVATADGSLGRKGLVTSLLEEGHTFFYACGPMPMLRAVEQAASTDGELNLEERMGCGFGACMGCSCKTKTGAKRVCREGPVFAKGEIEWQIRG